MKNASFFNHFTLRTRLLYGSLFFLIFNGFKPIGAQTDPLPFACAMCCKSENNNSFSADCSRHSPLWKDNSLHIPREDARTIYVRANFIFPRKSDDPDSDVQGNFSEQDAEQMAFLQEIIDNCNWRLRNLDGTSNCGNLRTDAKIQIVPNFIFLKDDYAWNADNTQGKYKCPAQDPAFWHLADLSKQIHSNPDIPPGINVFFPVQGDIYKRLVTLGTISRPDADPNYCRWWCSEWPTSADLNRSSNICITNLYLKYRWFQMHPEVTGFPFYPNGRAILVNEALRSLPHEFAHAFIDCYAHIEDISPCENHLLTTEDGMRNVLRAEDLGCIHRNLAISNLRQFVDCTETYNLPGSNASDRIVSQDETWDLNLRMYANVRVKTGATLTITCELLMPEEGAIVVERGARLIVRGGTIRRANTCSVSQYWQGVVAQGNSTAGQPSNPQGILTQEQGAVVLLEEGGMIEGAVTGVSTKFDPLHDNPAYRGALVQAHDFNFRDCQTGVAFLPYTFPNHSKFEAVRFEQSSTGSMQTGVSILNTDGISFEGCTFEGMSEAGIRSWDAVFSVKQKNRFRGANFGILAGASQPLVGQIRVGEAGLPADARNEFEDNTVGIRATSNARVEILGNNFSDQDFDVAINGTTRSELYDNHFSNAAAGNQFEYTGQSANNARCNHYLNHDVATNIVGKNTGFSFRGEDYNARYYDLFIEGIQKNPGELPKYNGGIGAALWNYFTLSIPENIKTSKVAPYGYTEHFYYVHPDQQLDQRVKPSCAANDSPCPNHSLFSVIQSTGDAPDCTSPQSPSELCHSKACLDAVRNELKLKTQQLLSNPANEALAAEVQVLTTARERITCDLVSEQMAQQNWAAIEALLNEDLNPLNRRRLLGAKLAQKQFQPAAAMLHSFPQNSEDDQYFVQIQNLNLARLSNPAFVLSAAQEAVLQQIASDASPEAGYAQSLLGILKGQVFMPGKPELGEERSAQTAKTALESLEIAPNPVSEQLTVRMAAAPETLERTLELRELSGGGLVKQFEVSEARERSIFVQNLPAGVYVLCLLEQGAVIARKKVIIQH